MNLRAKFWYLLPFSTPPLPFLSPRFYTVVDHMVKLPQAMSPTHPTQRCPLEEFDKTELLILKFVEVVKSTKIQCEKYV